MARKKKEQGINEVEKIWQEKWEEILVKKGKIDIEQLKKELFDFQNLIDKHEAFVCYATGDVLSKATYTLQSLKSAHDNYVEKLVDQAIKDFKEDHLDNDDLEEEEDTVESEDLFDAIEKGSFDEDSYEDDY